MCIFVYKNVGVQDFYCAVNHCPHTRIARIKSTHNFPTYIVVYIQVPMINWICELELSVFTTRYSGHEKGGGNGVVERTWVFLSSVSLDLNLVWWLESDSKLSFHALKPLELIIVYSYIITINSN